MYSYMVELEFNSCDPSVSTEQAVCIMADEVGGKVPGKAVLDDFSNVIPLFSTSDTTARDFGIILAIGAVYKIMYIWGIVMKTSQVSKFEPV